MRRALFFAYKAYSFSEVPVGAVLVMDNIEVGSGFNFTISSTDPSSHAEINCLRYSSLNLSNYRLMNSTLYVTLEPCLMCIGAILIARVKRVVYGANNIKVYTKNSTLNNIKFSNPFHKISFMGGILASESAYLLNLFFIDKR